MDSFDKKLRLKKLAALGLLFLLLILPLLMLREKIQNAVIEIEQQRRAETAIELREEMFAFKSDLQPEFFLQKFIKHQLQPEKFSQRMSSASGIDAEDLKNKAFAEIFAGVKNKFHAANLPFKPLFLVLADDKLQVRNSEYSAEFLRAPKLNFKDANNLNFLGIYLAQFSISEARGFARVKNFDYKKKFREFKKFTQDRLKDRIENDTPKFYFRGIISSFIKEEPQPGIVCAYFSDIFLFDNILFYSLPVILNDKFCGVFTVAYLQNDLAIADILPQALKMVNKKGLARQANWLSKSSSQSHSLVQQDFVEATVSSGDGSQKNLLLRVSLDSAEGQQFANWLESVDVSAKILLAIFFLLTFRVWFFNFSLNLGLRRKLLLIFSLTIFLPALIGYLTYLETAKCFEKFDKFMTKSRLESRFDKIDLIYQEVVRRQVLNNLRFKLPLSEVLAKLDGKNRNWNDFSALFNGNAYSTVIYDRFGHKIVIMNGRQGGKADLIKLNNSILALSNLSCLEDNEVTRKDLQNLSFTMAFAEDVAGVFDFAQIAGCEGENTKRASNIKDSSRAQFFLLPDLSQRLFPPFAIAMMDLGPELQFSICVRSHSDYPENFFSSRVEGFKSDVSLALRDSVTIQEEFWLEGFTRKSSGLSRLFRRALNSRNSSGYFDDTENIYHAWRFDERTPIVLAGSAPYNEKSIADFYLEFLPYVSVVALMLMLLLIAEVISRIFLSPLRTVADAVNHISATSDAAVRVEISCSDEFGQMGNSFNQMAQGLLQKKHISRFVSQRLVQAIEKSSEKILHKSSQMQEMTILSSDIRNFTEISENHPPELVVEILNEYFTLMEDCILSEGGIIDKFIGDAIIAVFIAENCGQPEYSACRAAFKMKKALAEYDFADRFNIGISNGVGIATGMALAANLGQNFSRRDFTIVGDMVQRAELLEAFTKSGNYSRIFVDVKTWNKVADKIDASEEMKFGEMVCRELITEVDNA